MAYKNLQLGKTSPVNLPEVRNINLDFLVCIGTLFCYLFDPLGILLFISLRKGKN